MEPSLFSLGLLRIGVVSPELRVADIRFNTGRILCALEVARKSHCRFLLFPELSITGYTCGDLFYQSLLIEEAREALWEITGQTRGGAAVVVGAPVAQGGRLFNCAVFIADGRILGVVPKSFLPNTQEFYEERWFSAAGDRTADELVWRGEKIPFGSDLLFQTENLPGCLLGIEICEDLWSVQPPSGPMAMAGATVLLNPSASPEILGKEEYRRDLVRSQSARCLAAYAYASAGPGESSTDLVYSGHSLIAENGAVLVETERFRFDTRMAIADIDVGHLVNERLRNNSFGATRPETGYRLQPFRLADAPAARLHRPIPVTPFVPSREAEQSRRCREIFALQTTGLARRLLHLGSQKAVVGLSGGLDSTLALLVMVKAFDKLGLDQGGVVAVTMPGPGTTARTRSNAEKLTALLGVTLRTIPIGAAVRQHFEDIGHDETVRDVTYENTQARERTQILMDIANQVDGLLVGTGDLSELALGWCTYNADHMSMYGVNAGVPKTLVRYLVAWAADEEFSGETSAVLIDICETPFSPELLPPGEDGDISQITEETVGPYVLHDFFLYHVVRLQYGPAKIFFLARQAFAGSYSDREILRWLRTFYWRFFSQQFKRSCLPDGPKVGSVVLSPRGDWRMPSDARADLWLAEVERLEKEL